MASLVELEPAPAITGTRPLASSMHHSTPRLCSSWFSVGLSPVVPTGTRPCVPSAICQLTSARKAASSSEPFLNGVTRAVNEPLKFDLATMNSLRTPFACRLNHRTSTHNGSDDPAKVPRGPFPAAILPRWWRTDGETGGFGVLSVYSIK